MPPAIVSGLPTVELALICETVGMRLHRRSFMKNFGATCANWTVCVVPFRVGSTRVHESEKIEMESEH
jgi:hypothetical protein